MASTRQRTLWARWKVSAFAALTAGSLVGACGNSKPADDGTGGGGNDAAVNACATPNQGCPCSGDGTTAACGQVVSRSDGYVSCSEGTLSCTGGTWGACVGQYTMFKSAGALGGDLTIQGLGTPMADAGACTVNPCDPSCLGFVDNSNGLDGGSSLVATDAGGWTLSLTSPDGGGCVGFQCQIASCDGGMKTQLTGTVYDPAGLNPMYHAQVFIPATLPLPAIPTGAQKDPCGGAGNLPPSVSYALTGPGGQFTLNNVPSGAGIPLVIQIGKWRRTFTLNVPSCTSSNAATLAGGAKALSLPSTRSQGNMPHMAVSSGSCDAMECLLKRIGVSTSEFCNPGAGCAVDFYQANGMNLAGGSNPSGGGLLSSSATMLGDDLIMLPCECGAEYGSSNPAGGGSFAYPSGDAAKVVNYTANGGRLFTSHWGRFFIEGGGAIGWPGAWPTPYPNVANWFYFASAADPAPGTVDTSSQKGLDFSSWLCTTGVTCTSTFWITPTRYDIQSLGGTSTQWVYYPWYNLPTDVSFDTPLGGGTTYGRVMYTDMHLSYDSSQCRDSNQGCTFPQDCTSGALSGQEKAAEFMLFDLQGCTSSLPPPPPPAYYPATFTRDFQGTCPSGTRVVWRAFYYEDTTPSDSSIVFTASTADSQPQLPTQFPAASLTTASGPNNCPSGPSCSSAFIGVNVDPPLAAAGVPTSGQPPYASHPWLRVNMALNPSSDHLQTSTLLAWNQTYDCLPSE